MSLTKATYSMITGAVYNVLDYGAVGNGVADDTAAITNAFTAAAASTNGAGIIYFPRGIYLVTGLNFNCSNLSVHFTGEGVNCSIIRKMGVTTAPVVKVYSNSNNKNVIISELEIDANYVSGVTALHLQDVSDIHVKNCTVWKANQFAVLCESVLVSTFEETRISNATLDGINFVLSSSPGARYNNHNVLRNCRILGNTRRGISFSSGSNLRILDCDIETNGTEGNITFCAVYIYNSIDDETGYGNVSIDGCWFEANQGTGIYAENASGGMLSVSNCYIIAPTSGGSSGECLYTQAGLRKLSLTNTICVGGTGTVNVNAENFDAMNCWIGTLSNNSTNYAIFGVKTALNDSVQITNVLSFPVVDRTTVQNSTLFNDLTSGKLAWKDSTGVVNVLY